MSCEFYKGNLSIHNKMPNLYKDLKIGSLVNLNILSPYFISLTHFKASFVDLYRTPLTPLLLERAYPKTLPTIKFY